MRIGITGSLLVLALWMGLAVPAGFGSPEKQVPSLGPWAFLEPGLHLGTFAAPKPSMVGDSLIRVLRINPDYFEFRLLNASATKGHKRLSVRDWAKKHSLVAAINANMYQKDNLTSVSLMKTTGHVNNTWYSKDRALLAFDPLNASLPKVQILDRDCQDVESLRQQYQTLVQSIRMIDCKGHNVWEPQDKIWAEEALGEVRETLERQLQERTDYLQEANEQLQSEVAERKRLEEALNSLEELIENEVQSIQDKLVAVGRATKPTSL